MSYKDELSDLDRDGERSLTQQLVDAIAAAIERGELGPGEKLRRPASWPSSPTSTT